MTPRRDEILKGCGKKFKPSQSELSVINHEEGVCGDWYGSTFFFCDNCQASLKEHDKTIAWVMEQIDEANREESEFWYKDRCERCGEYLLPSIPHWVDSFYKNIKARLTQSPHATIQKPNSVVGNSGRETKPVMEEDRKEFLVGTNSNEGLPPRADTQSRPQEERLPRKSSMDVETPAKVETKSTDSAGESPSDVCECGHYRYEHRNDPYKEGEIYLSNKACRECWCKKFRPRGAANAA